jgi:hypothetical protein
MLDRFDSALADARGRIAASDVQGAARALEAAREIDPTAPALIELSSRLADLARVRQSARVEIPAPRGAPTPAPSPLPAPPPPVAPTTSVIAEPPVVPQLPVPVPPSVAPAPPPPSPSTANPPPTAASPAAGQTPAPAAPSSTAPSVPTAEQDDAAIRRLTATYARAIETKDLNLFRSIKPNLSPEEERRLEQGFRAVTSQRVSLSIISIDRQANQATVVLQRRDTIVAGGREQKAESQQTLRLSRAGSVWIITEIR